MADNQNLYDVIVVGGGPAGLTAAIYLARAQYRVLVVEKERFGGQITITSEVVNYPGILKTNGEMLTGEMRRQAEGFGAEFLLAEVEALELSGKVKTVKTSKGELQCFGILIATGAHPRMIGFPERRRTAVTALPTVPPVTASFSRAWKCLSWEAVSRRRRSRSS